MMKRWPINSAQFSAPRLHCTLKMERLLIGRTTRGRTNMYTNQACVPPEDIEKMQEAAPVRPPVTPSSPRKLLVYSAAVEYYHDAIPWGVEALRITSFVSLVAKETAHTSQSCAVSAVYSTHSVPGTTWGSWW